MKITPNLKVSSPRTVSTGLASKAVRIPLMLSATSSVTGQDIFKSRQIQQSRFETCFQYGRLSDNHPVSVYVNNLLLRLGNVAQGKRVVVCPAWREINAQAYEDGVILLSGRLFEFCEYEEELLGVLAHEIHHQEKQHGLLRQQKQIQNLKDGVSYIGMIRAQEITADIQGSIVLLDSSGINPAGLQRFSFRLYELKKRFGSRDVSVSHGSWLSRFLMTAEAFHLYDFSSLSQFLTPIPEEQRENFGAFEYKGEILRLRVTGEEAEKIIPSLSLREALYTFKIYLSNERRDRKILNQIYQHIVRMLGNQEPAVKWAFWAIALHNPPDSVLKKYEESVNPDSLIKALKALAEMEELDYSWNTLSLFARWDKGGLFRHAFSLLRDKYLANLTYDEYYVFANEFYQVIFQLCEKKGTRALDRKEFFDCVSRDFIGTDVARFKRAVEDGHLSDKRLLLDCCIEEIPKEAKALFERLAKKGIRWEKQVEKLIALFGGDRERAAEALELYLLFRVRRNSERIAEVLLFGQMLLSAMKLYQVILNLDQGKVLDLFVLYEFTAKVGYFDVQQNIELLARTAEIDLDDYASGLSRHSTEKNAATKLDAMLIKMSKLDPLYLLESCDISRDELVELHKRGEESKEIFNKVLQRYFMGVEDGRVLAEIFELQKKGINILAQPGKYSYLLFRMFSNIDKELAAFSPIERATVLLDLCPWVKVAHIKQRLQAYALDGMWESLSFDEKLRLLFNQDNANVILDNERRELFVEEEAVSFDELGQVGQNMRQTVDNLVASGTASAGVASLLESLNISQPGKARSIVDLLLNTGESDQALKIAMWNVVDNEGQAIDVTRFTERVNYIEYITQLIFAFGALGKYGLTRSLLVTSGKILIDQAERKLFVQNLLDQSLAAAKNSEEQGALEVIQDAVKVVGLVEEWEPLYFALAGYLQPRLVVPPAKTYDLKEDYYVQQTLADSCAEGVGVRKQEGRKYKNIDTYEGLRRVEEREAREKPWENERFYSEQSAELIDTWLTEQLGDEVKPTAQTEKVDAFSFILEVAGTMGSVGVRFLQLLPLFVSLSLEAEEKFSRVYDRVKGQSKIVAADTIKREDPELVDHLEGVGSPIGGGSMRKVYRTRTKKEQEKRVLRVLNPNCRYKALETFDYLEKVINLLAEKGDKNYQTAQLVLAYVKEWVEQDIAATQESAVLDRSFKRENDNYSQVGFRYSIYVPQTYGPPNDYWQMEEEIEGHNLTDWDQLLKDGHDMKQIVCLLINNYFSQLNDGIVHSDVSIGNVRITPDNKIVWLDRNFLIKLSDEENALILGLLVGDNKARKETLLGFFNDDRVAQLAEELFQSGGDPAQKIQQFMIGLFGMGIKLPLSIILVLKNLLVLDKLAKKAGLGGMVEAFMFNLPEQQ